jgi:hypothetical protein
MWSVIQSRVFDAFLNDASHVPASVEHALNRHRVVSRLVVDQIIVEPADDPESQTTVTCFPAGAWPQFGLLAQDSQRSFRSVLNRSAASGLRAAMWP